MNRWTCVLAASALAACQPATPPAPSAPVMLPPVEASPLPTPPAVTTFSPRDGVYVRLGTDAGASTFVAWVRTTPRGVSVSVGPFSGHADAVSPGGVWRVRMSDGAEGANMTLRPPVDGTGPWRITTDDAPFAFEQHVGPLEARVRSRLLVGQRFVRLDQNRLSSDAGIDGAYTRDVITVLEHGLVRMELPDSHGAAGCVVDALMPLVGEDGVPVPSPLPATGDLGVVSYGMPKVREDCDDLSPDAGTHGDDGAARFFADVNGRVAGVLVLSYMYAEIFATPGLSATDLARIRRAARAEMERQAE